MHVAVFFQQYTSPAEAAGARHYALMAEWATRHTVTLVTASHSPVSGTARVPVVPDGVRCVTVEAPYRNGLGRAGRAAAFVRYAGRALVSGVRLPRPDVLLGVSTPLTAAATAAAVGALRGVPWVFDVKDLWPDFPVQMGAIPPGPLRSGLYELEKRLYRHAAHVVTLSPDMTARVREHGGLGEDRVTTLFNGTDAALVEASRDADTAPLLRAHGLQGKRVVLYAGTFGRANNVPLLIEVAEALARRGDAALVCVGGGHGRAALDAAAARLGGALCVPGAVARRDVFAWFRAADLALVSFVGIPVLGTTSPAKFFDALACGTPVVVMNDGWMRDLVERESVGAFVPADAPGAAARIAHLLDDPAALGGAGARAEALYRRNHAGMFDREAQARRYEDLFLRATSAR